MEERLVQRTRVKICGITQPADAKVAVQCGVDALGFIFYRKSPRNIEQENAAQIIAGLPPFVDRVGVFVNASIDQVAHYAEAGLSYIQLHGNESIDYCLEIRKRLPSCKIIKAFRVGPSSKAAEFSKYDDYVDCFLLDTYVKGEAGGTGEVFDWSIIDRLKLQRSALLAGGLSPDNVLQAMSKVKPYALDINSGIEMKPGYKDHKRMREIMRLVAKH